jgi:hypothetical protein
MKGALGRLWRLTRVTSIVVGLAVMVGLLAGVASFAVAAPSGTTTATAVLKGVTNTANAVTTLINSGTGPALGLQVQQGNAPLAVNSDTKVANLNADKLDGLDSGAFLGANGTAANADTLEGKDSTDFLGATAKAADSDKLDGKDSKDFLSIHPADSHIYFITRQNGGSSTQTVFCRAGDILLNGGFTADDDTSYASESRPTANGTTLGWQVTFQDLNGSVVDGHVWALCASDTPL